MNDMFDLPEDSCEDDYFDYDEDFYDPDEEQEEENAEENASKITVKKDEPKIFVIAGATYDFPGAEAPGYQCRVFNYRGEIAGWFRQYFEYGGEGDINGKTESETGESYAETLEKLEALLNDEGREISELAGKVWDFDPQRLEIFFCGTFPGVTDGLYDFLKEYFEDYIDAEEYGDEDWAEDFDPDDELLFVYNALKPNARRPLTENRTAQVFEMLDLYFS